MKGYPHTITIVLHKSDFSELLQWLREQGHVLRQTMQFGKNHHKTGDGFVTQQVCFADANKAMMFKLRWGGA